MSPVGSLGRSGTSGGTAYAKGMGWECACQSEELQGGYMDGEKGEEWQEMRSDGR